MSGCHSRVFESVSLEVVNDCLIVPDIEIRRPRSTTIAEQPSHGHSIAVEKRLLIMEVCMVIYQVFCSLRVRFEGFQSYIVLIESARTRSAYLNPDEAVA